MIGRKLLLSNNLEIHNTDQINNLFISEMFDFDKIKHNINLNSKRIIHVLLWVTIRSYIISANFLNKKRKEIIIKIKNILKKYQRKNIISKEKKEVSKYIKIISEYRQKIRAIKHKIKEEEGIE